MIKKPEKGQVINTKNNPDKSIDQNPSSHRVHCVSVRFNNKFKRFLRIAVKFQSKKAFRKGFLRKFKFIVQYTDFVSE